MTRLPDHTMRVNGETDDIEVATFTEEPFAVQVGVFVGREECVDEGVYRQVTVSTASGEACDLLLSVHEAMNLRDSLTYAIGLAMNAPDPS